MSSRGSAAGDTPGEREIIEHIRGRLPEPPPSLVVAIGDDAAVAVPERGALQVLTTDALVEGVHFERRFSSLADVGYKAIAVNASDVAAMGGTPSMALLSLMLPAGTSMAEIDALLDGVLEMAAAARVTVAGGNITRSPGPLIVDVTVTGHVRPRRVLTRSGGRPGDALYVTGTIGAAAAGLEWLREHPESGDFRLKAEATENRAGATENPAEAPDPDPRDPDPRGFRLQAEGASPDSAPRGFRLQAEGLMLECVQRHRRPEPRLRVGALLGRTRTASACMDLSDGLAGAVTQIAEASGTGAVIEASALPVHPGALAWFTEREQDPIVAALAGGDDYELLFAVKPKASGGRLRALAHAARGVSLTRIGELTEDPAVVLVRDGRPEPLPRGFLHF